MNALGTIQFAAIVSLIKIRQLRFLYPFLTVMDKKCPAVVTGHPCGLPIIRTGTLGELDVYECPKGDRTTFATQTDESKSEMK